MGPPPCLMEDDTKRRTAAALAIIMVRRQARQATEWEQRALAAEAMLRASWRVTAPNSTPPTQQQQQGSAQPHPLPRSTHFTAGGKARQYGLEAMLHHAAQLLPCPPPPMRDHAAQVPTPGRHHGPQGPGQPQGPTTTTITQNLSSASTFLDTLLTLPPSDLRRAHMSSCVTVLAGAVDLAATTTSGTTNNNTAPEQLTQSVLVQDVLHLVHYMLKVAAQPQVVTARTATGKAASSSAGCMRPTPCPAAAAQVLHAMQQHPVLVQLLMLACAEACAAAVKQQRQLHQELLHSGTSSSSGHTASNARPEQQAAAAAGPSAPTRVITSGTGGLMRQAAQHQRLHSTAVQVLMACIEHLPQALEHMPPQQATAVEEAGGEEVGQGLPFLELAVGLLCETLVSLQRPRAPCACMVLRAALARGVARLATVLQLLAQGGAQGPCDARDACRRLCLQLRHSFEPT